MSDWQPIETAPKDIGDILVFFFFLKEMMVAFWSKRCDGWQFAQGPYDGAHICTPQYWMPLPQPPEVKQ